MRLRKLFHQQAKTRKKVSSHECCKSHPCDVTNWNKASFYHPGCDVLSGVDGARKESERAKNSENFMTFPSDVTKKKNTEELTKKTSKLTEWIINSPNAVNQITSSAQHHTMTTKNPRFISFLQHAHATSRVNGARDIGTTTHADKMKMKIH